MVGHMLDDASVKDTLKGQTIWGWSDNKIWMGSWWQFMCFFVAILVRGGFGGGVRMKIVNILVLSRFAPDAEFGWRALKAGPWITPQGLTKGNSLPPFVWPSDGSSPWLCFMMGQSEKLTQVSRLLEV